MSIHHPCFQLLLSPLTLQGVIIQDIQTQGLSPQTQRKRTFDDQTTTSGFHNFKDGLRITVWEDEDVYVLGA